MCKLEQSNSRFFVDQAKRKEKKERKKLYSVVYSIIESWIQSINHGRFKALASLMARAQMGRSSTWIVYVAAAAAAGDKFLSRAAGDQKSIWKRSKAISSNSGESKKRRNLARFLKRQLLERNVIWPSYPIRFRLHLWHGKVKSRNKKRTPVKKIANVPLKAPSHIQAKRK
jgi:hypothetical protein